MKNYELFKIIVFFLVIKLDQQEILVDIYFLLIKINIL